MNASAFCGIPGGGGGPAIMGGEAPDFEASSKAADISPEFLGEIIPASAGVQGLVTNTIFYTVYFFTTALEPNS